MARLLIVDDEESIGDALRQVFEYEGHQVRVARDGPTGLKMLGEDRPDLTFLDVKMPGMDGLEVLGRIRGEDPQALVIMISGHGTIDTAVEATRKGAFDFLEKPLDTDRLLVTLRNALAVKGLSESVERLRTEVESRHEIVGSSFQIRQVLERVERVGPAEARVLINTRAGRHLYAVGGNETAARASGINVGAVKRLAYTVCGALSGLAGVVLAARITTGQPNAGVAYELDAIAAVVIGGTSLSGGVGGVGGTLLGVLLMGVLNNGLDLLNVSSYYQQIVKGLIIVGAVWMDQAGRR